jgi:hypothetical protein
MTSCLALSNYHSAMFDAGLAQTRCFHISRGEFIEQLDAVA